MPCDFVIGSPPPPPPSSTLDHHVANFGGFRNFGRGDKRFSICHIISKDHVFKGLSDAIGESRLY